MKTVLGATIALLLGVFLGGIGPRGDVRRLEAELAAAKKQAEQARATATPGASMLPSALRALAAAAAEQGREPRAAPPRFLPPEPSASAPQSDAGAERRRRGGLRPESIAAAKAGAEMMGAMQKAQFFDQARLTPDKQAAFERLVKEMNEGIAKEMDGVAALVLKQGRPGPTFRAMADVGARLLDVYRRADDQLKASLDDAGRAALEKTRFDMVSQVDLGILDKLVEVAKQRGEAQGTP